MSKAFFFLTAIWLPQGNFRLLYQSDSLPNQMLITTFYLFQPKGYQTPHNEVGSLSLGKHLKKFEAGTNRFLISLP